MWAFGHRTRAEMREPPPERFHHETFRAARPRPRPRPRPQVTLTVSRLTATGIAASRPDRDRRRGLTATIRVFITIVGSFRHELKFECC